MKADRLLAALLLLQAHGRLTGRALAERLEVSLRTVHRDMEALCAAGVPVFALRGARGGWQLDDNWRTRVPALDEAELRALLMAQPRAIGDPRLAASAERAITKLLAALPAPLRAHAGAIRQRLYVDPTGWYGTTELVSALPIVQDALARDRVLAIDYRPPGREVATRTVHPLGLVAKGIAWYLVARTTRGLRTFRVSRIEKAVIATETFDRPQDFDLASYWASSTEAFRSQQRYPARLRLEAEAAAKMRAWCRIVSDGPPAADGRVLLGVDFNDEAEARFVVLGLGAGVEVVEPASLRDHVAAQVVLMAARSPSMRPERRT